MLDLMLLILAVGSLVGFWLMFKKPKAGQVTVKQANAAVQALMSRSTRPNMILVPEHEARRWMAQHRRKKNHHKRKQP